MSREDVKAQDGAQGNWTLNLYEKSKHLKRRTDVFENREFDKYILVEIRNSRICFIDKGQLLLFGHEGKTPLRFVLPYEIGDSRTYLREVICSEFVAVGRNNTIEFINESHGNFQASNHVSLSNAFEQSPNLNCERSTSLKSRNELIIQMTRVEGTSDGVTCNQLRNKIVGLRYIQEFAKTNGVDAKKLWQMLMKEVEGGRVQVIVKVSLSTCLAVQQIQTDGYNLITLSNGSWATGVNQETSTTTRLCRQYTQNYEEIFFDTPCMDAGEMIQPECRVTDIFSEAVCIGNKGLIKVSKGNINENLKLLSFFNTQRIQAMLRYTDLVFPPNAQTPTWLISKSWQLHYIKYCNDLRKSGDHKLSAVVLQSIARHYQNPDAQLSNCLSKALLLIHKDNDDAEKYLSLLLKFAPKTDNINIFLGVIHFYNAYIALLKMDYWMSIDELDAAADQLQFYGAGKVKAYLCYFKGVVYKILAENCQMTNTNFEKKSIAFFRLYLQHIQIEENGFFAHKDFNCAISKLASVHLLIYEKTVHTNLSSATVALSEAKYCLKLIENSMRGGEIAEFESLKADVLVKESGSQNEINVFNAAIGFYKENPEIDKKAAKELKLKVKSVSPG